MGGDSTASKQGFIGNPTDTDSLAFGRGTGIARRSPNKPGMSGSRNRADAGAPLPPPGENRQSGLAFSPDNRSFDAGSVVEGFFK
jgi:hypothetical protein